MYYSIIYLIHSLIKKKLKKYRIKKNIENKLNPSKKENIDIKNENAILYQKNVDININEETALVLSKLSKKNFKTNKEISIFKKTISHYIIPENDNCNNLVFNIETKNNNYYKIICNMILNNVENVSLKISNDNKEFIYDMEESLKINEFSFVLDNNQFNNDNISINLYFYNDYKQIEIDNFYIEIIEKPKVKEIDPIIIFNVNDNYKPIYINVCNILDYINYNDINDSFFYK